MNEKSWQPIFVEKDNGFIITTYGFIDRGDGLITYWPPGEKSIEKQI